MTLSDWLAETRRGYQERDAWTATKGPIQELWQGFLKRAFARLNYRPSVWERDWDVLVIMDACRVDALRLVVDKDDRLPDGKRVKSVVSPASTSAEFMRSQFTRGPVDEKASAALICSNPHTAKCEGVSSGQWKRVEEVWRYYSDVGKINATPPRPVTDMAITVGRETNQSRMIVWYMQPHFPARTFNKVGMFKKLRDGEFNYSRVWEAYLDNVQWVINDIALLLQNLDAETVAVTADHGESFGEYGVYGHAPNIPTPQLKLVPWLTLTAEDTDTHNPEYGRNHSSRDREVAVNEQLSSLGYK